MQECADLIRQKMKNKNFAKKMEEYEGVAQGEYIDKERTIFKTVLV